MKLILAWRILMNRNKVLGASDWVVAWLIVSALIQIDLGDSLATTQPETRVSPTETLASKIQAILAIPKSDADPFAHLPQALQSFASKSGPDPSSFVEDCNSGGDFDVLTNIARNHDDFSGFIAPVVTSPPWIYGAPLDIYNFTKYLWGMAQQLATPPDLAAKYSRAAILLAASDEYFAGVAGFAFILRNEAHFEEVAGLSETQRQLLHDLLVDELKSNDAFGVRVSAQLNLQTDLILTGGNTVDTNLLANFLNAVTQYRPIVRGHVNREWEGVLDVWQVLNLARLRGNPAAEASVRKYLEDWRSEVNPPRDASDQHLVRLLNMALTETGPMPTPRTGVKLK